jgi:hypothetical protein
MTKLCPAQVSNSAQARDAVIVTVDEAPFTQLVEERRMGFQNKRRRLKEKRLRVKEEKPTRRKRRMYEVDYSGPLKTDI